MKLLALDASTEACSAALAIDGDVQVRFALAPREHSRLILVMLEELLAEAQVDLSQLDGLAFGRGPGAFTGVRIGAGTAQGIALARDLPVVAVSSLAALAQGMAREVGSDRVLCAVDARMGEVYWAAYRRGEAGLMELAGDERVAAPSAVPIPDEGLWDGAGTGWGRYGEALRARAASRLRAAHPARYPSAEDVAVLGAAGLRRGEGVSAEHALPVYLRDRVAKKPGDPGD